MGEALARQLTAYWANRKYIQLAAVVARRNIGVVFWGDGKKTGLTKRTSNQRKALRACAVDGYVQTKKLKPLIVCNEETSLA